MSDTADSQARNFVKYSTCRSICKGEYSVLACLEVLLACCTYIALAVYFKNVSILVFSACICPLLLLRSANSVACGVKWFETYIDSAAWNDNLSVIIGTNNLIS